VNGVHPAETPWQIVARNKRNAALGFGLGVILGAGAKYGGAVFLAIWLLAGGQ